MPAISEVHWHTANKYIKKLDLFTNINVITELERKVTGAVWKKFFDKNFFDANFLFINIYLKFAKT